jgi:hypothetical protein
MRRELGLALCTIVCNPGQYVTKQPKPRAMKTPQFVILLVNIPCENMDTVVVLHT